MRNETVGVMPGYSPLQNIIAFSNFIAVKRAAKI
jgi:hypothetical protein